MARADVAELYHKLRNNEFDFMPRGTHHLREVYKEVKRKYPHLCDDTYRCDESCRNGMNRAEWEHAVSRALDVLTTREIKSEIVIHGSTGYWVFR